MRTLPALLAPPTRFVLTALFAMLAFGLAVSAHAKDATSVLRDAEKAMGSPKTLQYSATGMNAFFGQALTAGQEWPRRELKNYTRAINYEQRSARDALEFVQPVFGGTQQNAQVNGDRAWNVGPNGPVPQLAAAEERQLSIWLTPHGFVKAALAARDAKLTSRGGSDVITFTTLGKYNVTGTLDAQHLVTKVETKFPNPVLGDMDIVATYGNYQDFGGVKFPKTIGIWQGGFPLWDLNVTSVSPNVSFELPVPEAVASATIPPVQVVSTRIADGVWHVTGGTHHSVVVEFNDYLAVAEAPLDERRSLAVISEAKRLAPNKPVRYVLTTHHHFDHTGGLRTYVGEGATVVTHQSNVPYFEKTLVAPATLVPDAQVRTPKKPVFLPVFDKRVITDGKQTIEVYATGGDTHTNEYTLIYLPGPGILVEGDGYSPGPPDAPVPATPPPNAVAMYQDIQRLNLNVQTIAPVHGRGAVPFSEMKKTLGVN
jgi:glyoxylase-like metal-dependent hydrolase (beta-lactamase superfamily II)